MTPPASATSERLEELLRARYSARAFRPEQVDRGTIERVLELAQRTASWCNTQPWHTLVLSGEPLESLRRALFEHAAEGVEPDYDITPPVYEGVSLARRRETGWGLYNMLGIVKGDRVASHRQAMENFRFFGAPHLAIVTSERALGPYGLVDCGGFLANFVLAAKANGVDTIIEAAATQQGRFVRERLGIPQERTLVCGIAFGYADEDHPANVFRATRAQIADAATFIG